MIRDGCSRPVHEQLLFQLPIVADHLLSCRHRLDCVEIKSEVPFKPPLNLYDNIEAAPLQCASPFRPPDNLNSNPQSVGAGAGTDKRTISEAQQQDVWSLTPLENNEMSQASQSWDAFPMRPPGSKSPYVSEDALHGFAFLGLSP